MIELKNLTFTVPETEDGAKTRTIIDNLSFTFEKGRFYAITGPNGSGKTSLLLAIKDYLLHSRHT